MAHIHAIEIENDATYLLEPILHILPTVDGNKYTANIPNFELVEGVKISMEMPSTNAANPTLNINNSGDKVISYEGTVLDEGMLQSGRTYHLIYLSQQWQIVGDLLQIPLADNGVRGGAQLGYVSDNASRKYAVELDNEQMYVHVPWEGSSVSDWNAIQNLPHTLEGYGITDAYIRDNVITLGNNSITPIITVNDKSGSAIQLTAEDIGLKNPLQLIGKVTQQSPYQPSDGTQGNPLINGINPYVPQVGDVILDYTGEYEYVLTASGLWERIGGDGAYKIIQTAVAAPPTIETNKWASSISQNENGEIAVQYTALETDGLWSGNAATATQFATGQKIYVDLTTRFHEPTAANPQDQITTIQGGKDTAEIIGIDGTLEVRSGGTGTDSFAPNQVILSTNPPEGQAVTFTSRPYSNSISAEALSISTNFVTEQDVYYGLPKINNLHNYTSDNDIFAPITGGQQYQILVSSSSTTAPLWATHAFINSAESTVNDQQAFTTLTLGNNIDVSSEIAHSEGQIELYSAAASSHILKGDSTTTQYTHILPNSDGHIAQVPSAAAVGSPTQPVFVAANGVITPLTYTPNRLYYSIAAATPATDSDSFTATIHYADDSHIGLGASNWPENCTDTLYVTGTTSFNGNVYHKSNVYFGNATNYYIDATATGYLPDLRVDKIQLDEDYINFYSHMNANHISSSEQANANQSRLLLGYIQGTNTGMLFHRCTLEDNGASATDPQNLLSQDPIFKFNGHLLPEETNTNDLGADLFRWKDAYFQGNIYMQNVSTPNLGQTSTANKIIWKSAYHDAEIYFSASQSDEAGKLVLHSKSQVSNTNGRLHSTIAIAFDDNDTAYINYSDPSFYPAINNSGYLGLSTNRWNKMYIGDNDTYGDDYTSIYWNDGAPKVVAPVQQYTFTINANTNGVTITHEAFTTDTYVLQIVITYGMENLNAPLTWTSYDPQGNQLGRIQLQCSALTSGLIEGYVITSRGKTYIPDDMTNYFTPINP